MTREQGTVLRRGMLGAAAIATVALLLLGCSASPGAPASSPPPDDRPVVLTTFTVLANIAQQVAGEHLRVESLTKVGAEIHGYEPTPGDLARAADADLILDNGLHLEAWFEQFVAGLDVPHVVVSTGVEPIGIAGADGIPNPHAWMSPRNVQTYVDNMRTAFIALAPEHADDFARNAAAYQRELQTVEDDLLASLAMLPTTARALVTCEGAFSYLARDAGLTERYIWAVNAEQQATPRQIAAVIDFVREREVPAVFCESTVSDRPMRQVVDSSDADYGGVLYVDSLSEPDGPVPTYLDLIRHDTATIIAGLSGQSGSSGPPGRPGPTGAAS